MFRERLTWIAIFVLILPPMLIPFKWRQVQEARAIEGSIPGTVKFMATVTGTFQDVVGGRRPVTRYWINWRADDGSSGQTLVPKDFGNPQRVELVRIPEELRSSPDHAVVHYDPRYTNSTSEIGFLIVIIVFPLAAGAYLVFRFRRYKNNNEARGNLFPQKHRA